MSKQQALAAIEQAQQLHLQRRQISQLTATLMFKHNINPGGLELTLILGNGAQSCNEKAIAYWVNKQMASIMQCLSLIHI